MDNRLTPSEAALYYGQQCQYVQFPVRGFTIRDVDPEMLLGIGNGQRTNCRLLLRPLSDITSEEIDDIAEAVGYEPEYGSIEALMSEFQDAGILTQIWAWAECVNQLRAIGIDCDQLIEQGKALDITKMQQR